jgi:predicted membrane protein
LTTATLNGWTGVGSLEAAPTSAGAVAARYERSMGDIQLDLRRLDPSTGADATPIVTTVDVGMGNAEVYLPADADVQVHCSVGVGNTDCAGLDNNRRGPSSDVRGTVGKPGGRPIILDVHAGMGNVEVHRG